MVPSGMGSWRAMCECGAKVYAAVGDDLVLKVNGEFINAHFYCHPS